MKLPRFGDFCCSIVREVQVLAILSLVYSIGLIVYEGVLWANRGIAGAGILTSELTPAQVQSYFLKHKHSHHKKHTEDIDGFQNGKFSPEERLEMIVSVVWVSSWILDIVFSIILFYAGSKKKLGLCKLWFYFRCAAVFFRIVFLLIHIIAGYSIIEKLPVVILFVIRLYTILLVYQLILDLEKTKKEEYAKNASFKLGSDVNYC